MLLTLALLLLSKIQVASAWQCHCWRLPIFCSKVVSPLVEHASDAGPDLLHFCLVFSLVFVGYAMLAHLIFGNGIEVCCAWACQSWNCRPKTHVLTTNASYVKMGLQLVRNCFHGLASAGLLFLWRSRADLFCNIVGGY